MGGSTNKKKRLQRNRRTASVSRDAASAPSTRENSSATLSATTPISSTTSSQVNASPFCPPIFNSLQTHNNNNVQRQHVSRDVSGMVPIHFDFLSLTD